MKKIVVLILVLAMALSCLVGCAPQSDPDNPTTKPTPSADPSIETPIPVDPNPTPSASSSTQSPNPIDPEPTPSPTIENVEGIGFNEFESKLINYLNTSLGNDNYMVSPASLKMALALAAAGARSNTLFGMLRVAGYETLDDYLEWAQSMLRFEDNASAYFDGRRDNKWEKDYDSVFSIANGIWHNSDMPGKFLDTYIDKANEMGAEFNNTPGEDLKDEINEWIDKETHGLIPEMFKESLEEHINILVNALYMKNRWRAPFNEETTHEGDFTTIDGKVVTKELMEQTNDFKYYEDDDCQVLILCMDYGFNMAVVLGDNSDIVDKIKKADYRYTHVVLPKFEVESTFEDEIVDYLKSVGMFDAFARDGAADFTNMMDVETYINTIIQKTKLSVDENGLEAAAVTAIIMDAEACTPMEPAIPIEFIADKPFTFYIYVENEELASPELLFYGQYVE